MLIGSANGVRRVFTVLHVKPGGRVEVVVQSADAVVVGSHWHDGRAMLCPGDECPYCRTYGRAARGHAWLLVGVRSGSSGVCLLEMPERVYWQMVELGDVGPGQVWRLSRAKQRGAVSVEVLGGGGKVVESCVGQEVLLDGVARVYGMPGTAGRGVENWVERVRPRLVRWWQERLGTASA